MFNDNEIICNIVEIIDGSFKKKCVGCGCNIVDEKIFYDTNNEKAVYAIPCCDDCRVHIYNILQDWSY